MSLFNGLINIKVAEILDLPRARQAVINALLRSRSAVFRNIPLFYIEELKKYLHNREVDISVNEGIDPPPSLKPLARFYRNRQAVKVDYYGKAVEYGNIFLARVIFDVAWLGDEILEISSVTYHECLACNQRHDLWFEDGLEGGVAGGILEPASGWKKVVKEVSTARKIIINNVPDFLLDDLEAAVQGKEVKILVPAKHRVPPGIRNLPSTRAATRLLHTYTLLEDGSHAHVGGIALPHAHYGIAWTDRLVSIRTIYWPTCIKCMVKAHLTGWSLGLKPGRFF
ncbi:MAG: hypothetical protein ACE5GM_05460 [bacterium]